MEWLKEKCINYAFLMLNTGFTNESYSNAYKSYKPTKKVYSLKTNPNDFEQLKSTINLMAEEDKILIDACPNKLGGISIEFFNKESNQLYDVEFTPVTDENEKLIDFEIVRIIEHSCIENVILKNYSSLIDNADYYRFFKSKMRWYFEEKI